MAEAAFQRVASEMRARIEAGEFARDKPLPPVTDIAVQYEVSKQTAHNAIKALVSEGLLRSVYRQGTYIRERPREQIVIRDRVVYRDELGYYFDRNAKDWRAVERPTRGLGVPPNHVADLLGVPQGTEVLVRDRAMGPPGSDRPLQLATSYIPLRLTADIPALGSENTGPGGIYDRLEEHYGTALEWRETISARVPTDEEQRRLALPPTVPVLVVTREALIHKAGQTVVAEVNETRMTAEQFAVAYSVRRDRSAARPDIAEGNQRVAEM